MRIWTRPISVEILTGIHTDTAVGHLGVEFLEVGDDFIRARVPVDTRTRQPYGLLHGGVSVVLAETPVQQATLVTLVLQATLVTSVERAQQAMVEPPVTVVLVATLVILTLLQMATRAQQVTVGGLDLLVLVATVATTTHH